MKDYNRQWALPLSKWIVVNLFVNNEKKSFGGHLTVKDILENPRFVAACKEMNKPASKLQALKCLHSRDVWMGVGFQLCREIMIDKTPVVV